MLSESHNSEDCQDWCPYKEKKQCPPWTQEEQPSEDTVKTCLQARKNMPEANSDSKLHLGH